MSHPPIIPLDERQCTPFSDHNSASSCATILPGSPMWVDQGCLRALWLIGVSSSFGAPSTLQTPDTNTCLYIPPSKASTFHKETQGEVHSQHAYKNAQVPLVPFSHQHFIFHSLDSTTMPVTPSLDF